MWVTSQLCRNFSARQAVHGGDDVSEFSEPSSTHPIDPLIYFSRLK